MQRTSAPLDLAAVERVLRPYDRALTLPGEALGFPEVFAWEQAHLFEGSVVLCRTDGRSRLGHAGDQVALQVGRQSFLLVRGDDMVVRVFHNICRHRGHELLGVGEHRNQRGIRCPYHAWVYGLGGDLRATPRFNMDSLDKADFPLVEARSAEWRGWLFVNASGDAPDLTEYLGNLDIVVDGYAPETLRLGAKHDTSSRRIGRSPSRTTASATTVRRSTRSCAASRLRTPTSPTRSARRASGSAGLWTCWITR